jgi:hypothetical protein
MARQSLAPSMMLGGNRLTSVPASRLSGIERRQSNIGRPSLGLGGTATINSATGNSNNNTVASAKR